jgi:hypothetical protein
MEEMDDRTLAEFLTTGIVVETVDCLPDCPPLTMSLSISEIARGYALSFIGVKQWLSSPQEFKIVEGDVYNA